MKNILYKKKEIIIGGVLSLALSFFFILGNRIDFSGEIHDKYLDTTIREWKSNDILLFFLVFLIIFFLYTIIKIIITNKYTHSYIIENKRNLKKKEVIIGVLIVAFICWLAWSPYFLAFYPGSVMGDSFKSIREIMGINEFTNHHPILYTLLIGFFIKIGNFIWNYNFGVFLYVLFQSSLMALVIGKLIVWLYNYGIKIWFCILSILFYAILPVFPAYAMILWKDPLFSCALLYYMMIIADVVLSKGQCLKSKHYVVKLVLTLFFIMALRNNGIYIVFITIAILAVSYRTVLKGKWFCIIAFVLMYTILNSATLKALDIKTEFVESVGVPLQQMARVVVEEGEMSDEEKNFLYDLLPEEEYYKSYQPALVDSIKWNSKFDEQYLEDNKVNFIKTWFGLLKNNFSIYVDAYCLNTFGFWMPGVQTDYGYADRRIQEEDNVFNIHQIDLIKRFLGFPLREYLEGNMVFIGSGSLAWLMLIVMSLLICVKRRAAYVLLPPLLNWLTYLVATPAAFGLRYVFILLLSVPLMIVLPFIFQKRDV